MGIYVETLRRLRSSSTLCSASSCSQTTLDSFISKWKIIFSVSNPAYSIGCWQCNSFRRRTFERGVGNYYCKSVDIQLMNGFHCLHIEWFYWTNKLSKYRIIPIFEVLSVPFLYLLDWVKINVVAKGSFISFFFIYMDVCVCV